MRGAHRPRSSSKSAGTSLASYSTSSPSRNLPLRTHAQRPPRARHARRARRRRRRPHDACRLHHARPVLVPHRPRVSSSAVHFDRRTASHPRRWMRSRPHLQRMRSKRREAGTRFVTIRLRSPAAFAQCSQSHRALDRQAAHDVARENNEMRRLRPRCRAALLRLQSRSLTTGTVM